MHHPNTLVQLQATKEIEDKATEGLSTGVPKHSLRTARFEAYN